LLDGLPEWRASRAEADRRANSTAPAVKRVATVELLGLSRRTLMPGSASGCRIAGRICKREQTCEQEVRSVKVRRTIAASVLALAVLGGTAGVALGHECFIASRSAQGDAGATHSAQWERLTLADIFGFINSIVGGPALSSTQIEWAVAEAVNEGLPVDGWVVRSDKTIGEGSSNPNLANGKGLDHLADVYGPQIVGIYFQALGH